MYDGPILTTSSGAHSMPDGDSAALDPMHALDLEIERLGIECDVATRMAFSSYLDLIQEWNQRAGLTAISKSTEVVRRLFSESIALLVALRGAQLLPTDEAVRVADLGPGGGFPGLPMRLIAPGLQLVLIESKGRRCEFLETVVANLGLANVLVVNERAEDAGRDEALRESFDLVVARAVAPLPVLVEYALPLLRAGGVLATPKGSRAAEELAEARGAIEALGGVALEAVPLSIPEGAPPQQVLLVQRDSDLNDRYPRRAGMPSKRPLA
jgi:16S rRNA (guanine527-N7)-methyltransferase